MTNTVLFIIWGLLYLLCGVLGIVSVPDWVGILACCAFFVPPAVLLYRGGKPVKVIRVLSIAWLAAALVLLILNIASVGMTELAGNVLYYMLVVICAPMVCGQYWILSLFGVACLLMVSLKLGRKK